MKNKSFSRRLSNRVIILVSLVYVLGTIAIGVISNEIIADEATRSTQRMLHGTISELELPLNEVEVAAQTVASIIASSPDISVAELIVRRTVELDTLICGGSVIFPTPDGVKATMCYEDSNGIAHSYPFMGGWAADSWVNLCLSFVDRYHCPFWAEPYQAEGQRDQRVTAYCYPIYRIVGGDSTLYAVLTAELPVDWMERKCESLRPYDNSLTTINCGNVVIGLHDSVIIAEIRKAVAADEELQQIQEDMILGRDSMRRFGKGSKLSFIVYGPLHNGWMVSVVCQYKEVLRHSFFMHINLLIVGILVLAVLYVICRRSIHNLTRPITELSDAALRMAKGDLGTKMPEIKSEDEMMQLRDSFVFMQNSITDYIEELKTTTAVNERMESELNVARNIQMGMLCTDFPPNLSAKLVPAKEVGGDLYDFVKKDGFLYFTIGDVSGKGVPASLMMAITRAGLRFVAGMNQSMDKLLERINISVTDTNSSGMFVTLFMGRINLATNHMEYCNAGHNPIIIVPPDGEPFFLKAKTNLAIGLFEDFRYESESMDLVSGTRLILYTDGVNEAENHDKQLFGNDRLLAWAKSELVRNPNVTDKEVVDNLYETVRHFANGSIQNDDITIMSILIS